jgi:hypothetical protein
MERSEIRDNIRRWSGTGATSFQGAAISLQSRSLNGHRRRWWCCPPLGGRCRRTRDGFRRAQGLTSDSAALHPGYFPLAAVCAELPIGRCITFENNRRSLCLAPYGVQNQV